MERVTLLSNEALHDGWIDPQYIPAGKDKYHIRNQQARPPKGGWRHLRSDEIERLVKTGNSASSWDTVWVADEFDPSMVRDNKFYGTVRIGRIGNGALPNIIFCYRIQQNGSSQYIGVSSFGVISVNHFSASKPRLSTFITLFSLYNDLLCRFRYM